MNTGKYSSVKLQWSHIRRDVETCRLSLSFSNQAMTNSRLRLMDVIYLKGKMNVPLRGLVS